MGKLFEDIKAAVASQNYLIGLHASERLEERGIMEWQAVDGLAEGTLLLERKSDKPNPIVEVLELMPDGMEFKAVWSFLKSTKTAKLVTLHFLEDEAQ